MMDKAELIEVLRHVAKQQKRAVDDYADEFQPGYAIAQALEDLADALEQPDHHHRRPSIDELRRMAEQARAENKPS